MEPLLFSGIFFIVWLLIMSAFVVGYIILLVAAWRAMRAHESIAHSVRDLSHHLRTQPQTPEP